MSLSKPPKDIRKDWPGEGETQEQFIKEGEMLVEWSRPRSVYSAAGSIEAQFAR